MRYTNEPIEVELIAAKFSAAYQEDTVPQSQIYGGKRGKEFFEWQEDDNKLYDALEKLSDLEDIEEDLGVDLVIFFKALKNGIYVNEDYCDYGTTNNFLGPDNIDCDLKLKQFNTNLFFKDYGKTWALTKEEL